jgi:hypothetical protein
MRQRLIPAVTLAMSLSLPAWSMPLPEAAASTRIIPIYHDSAPAPDLASGPPIGRILQGAIGIGGTVAFLLAGTQMIGLRSVSGTSVAESYYQSMGIFSLGMAAISGCLAVDAFSKP